MTNVSELELRLRRQSEARARDIAAKKRSLGNVLGAVVSPTGLVRRGVSGENLKQLGAAISALGDEVGLTKKQLAEKVAALVADGFTLLGTLDNVSYFLKPGSDTADPNSEVIEYEKDGTEIHTGKYRSKVRGAAYRLLPTGRFDFVGYKFAPQLLAKLGHKGYRCSDGKLVKINAS